MTLSNENQLELNDTYPKFRVDPAGGGVVFLVAYESYERNQVLCNRAVAYLRHSPYRLASEAWQIQPNPAFLLHTQLKNLFEKTAFCRRVHQGLGAIAIFGADTYCVEPGLCAEMMRNVTQCGVMVLCTVSPKYTEARRLAGELARRGVSVKWEQVDQAELDRAYEDDPREEEDWADAATVDASLGT
jgi:hypothetical protein